MPCPAPSMLLMLEQQPVPGSVPCHDLTCKIIEKLPWCCEHHNIEPKSLSEGSTDANACARECSPVAGGSAKLCQLQDWILTIQDDCLDDQPRSPSLNKCQSGLGPN